MHLDDEALAQWALDGVEPDQNATEHLRGCQACQASLAELRALVEVSRDLPPLEAPPAHVWERIVSDLDHADTSSAAIAQQGQATATQILAAPVERPARVRIARAGRRTVALAAGIAAILGLGAGVAGTKLLDRQDDGPTSQYVIKLDPLQGKSGDGTADLIRSGAGTELRVSTAGLPAPNGYYEVWLINQDGKRMVSLGILDAGAGGTYVVPPELTAQGYRIVDVSLEPDDGNPEHSHDSIIRGTLPA